MQAPWGPSYLMVLGSTEGPAFDHLPITCQSPFNHLPITCQSPFNHLPTSTPPSTPLSIPRRVLPTPCAIPYSLIEPTWTLKLSATRGPPRRASTKRAVTTPGTMVTWEACLRSPVDHLPITCRSPADHVPITCRSPVDNLPINFPLLLVVSAV